MGGEGWEGERVAVACMICEEGKLSAWGLSDEEVSQWPSSGCVQGKERVYDMMGF